MYGLAAMWVLIGSPRGACTATAQDGYSATPFVPELDADLGNPVEEPRQRGNGWSRSFDKGWAAVNLNSNRRREVTFSVPSGLSDMSGRPAPHKITLQPHNGILYQR